MPDTTQDSATSYMDAVKWMVGLSGAVIAGVFLHPEIITRWSGWGRIYVAVVLSLFGISISSGVVYLLWIARALRRKELIAEVHREQTAPVVIPDPKRVTELREQKKKLDAEEATSKKLVPRWYQIFTWSFYVAALLGLILFCVQITIARKPDDDCKDKCKKTEECCKTAPPNPKRYTVVQSAVHKTAHGMMAHTFLLDQQTGDMWQMICDQKGSIVAFQRVRRLDAQPEEIEETKGALIRRR